MESCYLKQGSKEWFEFRLGRVSASRVNDVMAKTKNGDSSSRKNYMAQLICERLTGQKEESFTSAAMKRGTELEPLAREIYILNSLDAEVHEVGSFEHPSIKGLIASPDGLIGDEGLVEIKCPNTWTHITFIKSKKIKKQYMLQMHAQMMCTGRKWCDFVSYDDRLPDHLSYMCVRVHYDELLGKRIESEVIAFLYEMSDEITLIEAGCLIEKNN